ncbi:MAG: hypothetical protein HY548_04505 [Elusimicrobia bacterium]|nr:hypothetical protein [Elusimicrobiota bacterium]
MALGGYFGAIRISDGITSEWTHSKKIVCHGGSGVYTVEFLTNGNVIAELKVKDGNRLVEWIRFGAFHRAVSRLNGEKISKPMTFHFHPKTRQSLHGLQERQDQMLFDVSGKTRSWYSRGKWIRQEFRYKNRRLAFRLGHTDRGVTIKYPDGTVAGIVRCPSGFSTRGRRLDRRNWGDPTPHRCRMGEIYFPFQRTRLKGKAEMDDVFDFSKDGNSSISFRTREGKVWLQGQYQNRQRIGEWILNGKHVFYIRGVPVAKKLWDTAPTKLRFNEILRIKNAQLRAALISRAGYERLAKEVKHKVVHEDKSRRNKLMEFPIKVDDGNGARDSNLRILQVTCTSTGTKYFLNVPDFVWDAGRRTRLDTCEAARQWTFGVNNPRERIKFALET